MATDTSDVASKLMAWMLGGTGALLVYSAFKKENPIKVLTDTMGAGKAVSFVPSSGAPLAPADPNSRGAPPGTSEASRLRMIASRLISPTLVNIPPGGQLDIAAAGSLSRINARLGFTVQNVGAYRSYAEQAALYASDPERFGSPEGSMHVVGLAIDVHAEQMKNANLVREFVAEGWHRVRWIGPGHCGTGSRAQNEEHHWSYGVCG